jgi:putative DNA primase/helicase
MFRREVWRLMEELEQKGTRPSRSIYSSVVHDLQGRLYIPEERLDAQHDLVNLQNGIYNMEDGNLYPHKPDYYLTTQLPFGYDATAPAPTWQMYLLSTFVKPRGSQHDPQLVDFLQEAMGYSLTTDVSRHVMFWCYGTGANGKGVLFHVLESISGEASMPLNIGMLRREPYQLAMMAGIRIVLCSEANATDNLVDDAQVKAMVAGDTMPVRNIYQKPFALQPTAKLWWAMNKLPAVADTSEGFWRRLRVIPFNRHFGKQEQVLDLKDKLDLELPGIFNWAMQGLRRIRNQRDFTQPTQVIAVTDDYRQGANPVCLFIDEECIATTNKKDFGSSSALYAAYQFWCKENGFRPKSARGFRVEMDQLKYYYDREPNRRFYSNIRLRV